MIVDEKISIVTTWQPKLFNHRLGNQKISIVATFMVIKMGLVLVARRV
jgi:hypothetical protein